MKKRAKLLALLLTLALLIVCTVTVISAAENETPHADYTPKTVSYNYQDGSAKALNNTTGTNVMGYLNKTEDGNLYYVIAPAFNGNTSAHTYLSYRDDSGGNGLVYLGADINNASSYAKDCTASFVTLDLDLATETSLPDYMSISLNARGMKSNATGLSSSSPAGNLYIGLKDTEGTLEIANNNATKNGNYTDTGIDITKGFVHLTLVLDLRPVINAGVGGKADLIKAYLYVNGEFFSEMAHGFNSSTDFINEIRIEMGASGSSTCSATDTVAVDNVTLRQFVNGEYNGNLGSVISNTSKTLNSFDLSLYDSDAKVKVNTDKPLLAKIGTKNYYSMGDLLADAKSGDKVRFFVPVASSSGNLTTTVGQSNLISKNFSTGKMSDGVVYELFDASGNLVSSNSGTAGTELTASVNGKAGTVEFYSDYTSSAQLVNGTNFPSGEITLSLNGNSLGITKNDWFSPATATGKQYLEVVGKGNLKVTGYNVINIGAGAIGSSVTMSDVDIVAPGYFIAGQVIICELNRCTMKWTDANSYFISTGGPNRNGYQNKITMNECVVEHDEVTTADARGFFRANTISNGDTAISANATVLTLNSCEFNTPGYPLMFSHWNTSHNGAKQPAPSVVINNSNVNVSVLVNTGYGTAPSVTVDKDSTVTVNKVLAKASGSMATASSGTLYSTVTVNAAEGSVWNIAPASSGNVTVKLGGRAMPLANGNGYVIATPGVKANISLNSDFNFNLYIPAESFVSAKVDGVDMIRGKAVELGTGTYEALSYNEIAPSTAGVDFTANLVLTDGRSSYVANYTVSVAKYLKQVLSGTDADSDVARARSLVAAIVKYIDEAYTYFESTEGYEAIGELVTLIDGIETESVDMSTLESVIDTEAIKFAVSAAQMELVSTPTARIYVKTAYTGTITVNGVDYSAVNGTVNGKNYIELKLPARCISDTITIGVEGKSGKFNLVSYYNYLKEQGDTKATALLQTLVNYGAEAAAYQPHVFGSWQYNETHHWRACNDTSCGMMANKSEHVYSDEGVCECGSIYNFGMGEGEILGSLGLTENVKTGRDDMKFAKLMNEGSVSYTFTSDEASAVKIGNTVLFSFVVKAQKATKVSFTVDLGSVINYNGRTNTVEYTVPAQWTRIYLPVVNNGMKSVSITADDEIQIAEARFDDMGKVSVLDLQLKSGMWMVDEFDSHVLTEEEKIETGAAIDIIKSGNYIYSIGNNKFTVSDATTKKVITTLSGFGTLRQMAITDDGKYAVISGRQNGVYIVSLENPTAPKIASTYNTIEQATGIFVSGGYAFVGNRQYGVEVVDIKDPLNPVHVANIHSGEVQSCVVYKGILYAGVWADCGVYMYDLNDLSDSPDLVMIGKVTTNGKGDGMSVVEIGGRVYLFAATGQHTYNANNEDSAENLMLGQGNGMDIFDVTDPAQAKWISTSKIDGRYYYTGNDYWETEVSYDSESGKWYAYLVNTYNGVYVYDVTDLAAPVRLAHITIEMAAGSSPALTHATRTILTTWDQTKIKRSPVGAIVVDDGRIFIAGAESNVYVYETPYAFAHTPSADAAPILNVSDSFYDFDNVLTGGTTSSFKDGSFTHIASDTQILAVATNGNYVYVAAGSGGVIILDKTTLAEVGRIGVSKSANGRIGYAQDVKAYGNKLFVAEDVAGLRVYDISESRAISPVLLSVYSESEAVTQVTVASDGNFAVLHMSGNYVRIVNTSSFSSNTLSLVSFKINDSNTTANRLKPTGGNMYHHNLSTLVADRYVALWNHISTECWIDFGPADARYTTPEVISTGGTYGGSYKTAVGMQGGITGYTKDGVYYAVRVEGVNVRLQTTFTSYTYTQLFKASTTGRPTVAGDYLIISERIYGKIAFYTLDGTYKGMLTVDGNPDVAYADGSTVYIPLGYQGLLVVDTAKAF